MRTLDYQIRVLDTLEHYLDTLKTQRAKTDRIAELAAADPDLGLEPPDFSAKAWEKLKEAGRLPRGWRDVPFSARLDEIGRPVPSVTLKVPTGGGKTFLAANGVSRVISRYLDVNTGFVLWIVPNEAIYSQTLKHLKDRRHPYRKALDRAAADKVKIMEKSDRLHARDVESHLCVMVLMLQSSNRQDKATLRMFRDRGDVHGFFPPEGEQNAHAELIRRVPNLDAYNDVYPMVKDSLGNALRLIQPIVVMDEGQKATSDLAFKTLYGFNPLFVMELTATPKRVSARQGDNPRPARDPNVLVEITGREIHDEGMIKMPLNLDPRQGTDWRATLAAAKERLEKVTAAADAFRAETSRYIRPIMLVQVERTGKEQRKVGLVHAEDVREWLLSVGYKENQIAVKTSEQNDLRQPENLDLMSEQSDVRVIITKSALQEGWDCPFAYVLCSLAASRNLSAMTQLVGRILRQPHALKSEVDLLDECYVVTHHAETARVVDAIRKGLEGDGLSDLVLNVSGDPGDAGAGGGTRTIKRRPEFETTEIFLPEVFWCDGSEVRPLDYETDLLSRVNWAQFDPSEVISRIPETGSAKRGQMRRLSINEDGEGFDEAAIGDETLETLKFDPVYAVRALMDLCPNPFVLRDIVGATIAGLDERGLSPARIGQATSLVIEELRRDLEQSRNEQTEILFREDVQAGRIRFRLRLDGRNWRMPKQMETRLPPDAPPLMDENGDLVSRSLFYPFPAAELNAEERGVAVMLDGNEAINWWHRNVATAAKGYGIQGWKRGRIYPDFIFATGGRETGGRLVALETKGDHLQNPDTEYKRELLRFLTEEFRWEDAPPAGEIVECALILMVDIPTHLPELVRGRT
ncbi:DEAD/DEAH box helicase family protein [Aquisalimonas sp. 2447]|uniref:DEAD/DEAH box helicase n=1 Tax=Aquisalimonas sp. 2447 TaxID=2740807 RepID=UPI0014326640|nr:DEAD/DEAH box helicase family protein [Aquisalimonas sp. 2447]QIT55023.1 DEAD/DEAH box helicase family protein [Aquisalimonas sp. 2447]